MVVHQEGLRYSLAPLSTERRQLPGPILTRRPSRTRADTARRSLLWPIIHNEAFLKSILYKTYI